MESSAVLCQMGMRRTPRPFVESEEAVPAPADGRKPGACAGYGCTSDARSTGCRQPSNQRADEQGSRPRSPSQCFRLFIASASMIKCR